jgi:hypothetical protein
MNRREAVDYLHNKGYSRRLSAKLADVAIQYDGALAGALKKALDQKLGKGTQPTKVKFIIKK